MKEMTKKEINRRKNGQRAVVAQVKIYDYGFANFSEPSKSRLESLRFKIEKIRTYRRDYDEFCFVKCKIGNLNVILVVKFEENQIERSSCQLLKKWDPRASFI
jgi:hypothetical protein